MISVIERTASGRPWHLLEPPVAEAMRIAQHHGLPEIVARVLALRHVACEDVPDFLEPRLRNSMPDPSHLLDLERATQRLIGAIERHEPIGLIGDYDVDGASSTALLIRFLRALDTPVHFTIPDRMGEGYGANPRAFDELGALGCRLVLTLDNGTTAHDAIAHACAAGQDVIVVDHHAAEDRLPPAHSVINPNRLDQQSPLTDLAACGVVYVLLVALCREIRRRGGSSIERLPDLMGLLDLVALGTVCDVVPLVGLNRAFVQQGLKLARKGSTPGLAALARVAGIGEVREAGQFGFALGPRLNAAGRLGRSLLATELLAGEDGNTLERIAVELDGLNRERRQIEERVNREATQMAEAQIGAGRQVLVVAGEGWHPGVVGIVAGRLMERFQKPVFAIAFCDGIGKGSARSVPGFDLGRVAIDARAAGLLVKGGGHAMAAGITIERDALTGFESMLEERAAGLEANFGPAGRPLELDGPLTVGALNADLADKLERIAPFGPGNAEPRFCIVDAMIAERRELKGGHIACTLNGTATGRARAIAFRAGAGELGRVLLQHDGPLRLAGRLRGEEYRGQRQASFHIDDAAPA